MSKIVSNHRLEEALTAPPELDEDRLLRFEGEVVAVRMTPEKKIRYEHMVVTLLPLEKEPNRSLCRLFRASPSKIVDPTFIGTDYYRDLFILRKAKKYAPLTDLENPQRFSYEVNGFDDENELKHKEIRKFNFVYEDLVPNVAKQRLASEFMTQLSGNCAYPSIDSAQSFSETPNYLSLSPVEMLLQTMMVLRDFEYSEHLQYVDVEVINVELTKKNPKLDLEPKLPSGRNPSMKPKLPPGFIPLYEPKSMSKRFPPLELSKHALERIMKNEHLQRCRVTGNHACMISEQGKDRNGVRVGDLGDRLKDATANVFERYGEFVGRHPGKVLIATLVFTVLCIPGLAFIKINLDLYKLFVPSDAPVRHEFEGSQVFNRMPLGNLDAEPPPPLVKGVKDEIIHQRVERSSKGNFGSMPKKKHKKAVNAPIHNDILRFYVVHKNYENLLESEILKKLYDYTNKMMKVKMNYADKEWTFEDFCKKATPEDKCDNNLNVWLKHAENLFRSNGSRVNPNLQLSYPVMYLFNRPKDIGNIIYGVNVTGQKHEITGARVLTIHWFVAFPVVGNSRDAYFAYREELNKYWEEKTEESDIKFIPHNDKAMDDELRLIIETAIPFALPATLQLMVFVYFTNLSKDIRKSKPVEAFFGVICVVLGLICTFGMTFYAGLPFNPVSSTMPFLILAVGVDDAFMILGAWRMTNPRLSVEKRMGITMGDAGASITVTSLTNFGCFALGYFLSPTPAVADFCTLTAIGMLVDYIFQVTFFASIMVYGGMREEQGGIKTYFRWKKSEVLVVGSPVPFDPERKDSEIDRSFHEPTLMHRLFKEYYAPFILKPKVKAISWVFFIVYICVSFYGCSNMKVDISPKKYIRDNSPIQTFVHLADKYIWADNVMPHIHIMNPPDLRDPVARNKFNELIFQLENTNYSIGRVSTNLWVWEYQSFLNDFPDVKYERDFYKRKYLRQFFSQFDYQQFRSAVKINDTVPDGEPCVAAFTFQTSFYGLDSWDKRQTELFRWRAIINEYPEFDAFLANIFSPFLIDQRKTIAPSSMQSVGSAIAVMAIISMFFLPDKQSVFVMSFSLISISTGVCGFLCLWGSDLDSVSMGCIIMAIGLAVDFSIHICYRYHCSKEPTAELKVIDTLSLVGYPILQAGGSTLWAMTTLPFVPAYLVRVFFQTVVLVNVFGLIHALVWLPQFISAIDPIERIPRRIKHPHND